MFSEMKAVAAIGVAATGLGFISVLSPYSARALPAQLPAAHSVSCPGGRGVHYLPDPKDTNAYFVCRDGVQTQHSVCPPIAKLVIAEPPTCAPQSNHHMA